MTPDEASNAIPDTFQLPFGMQFQVEDPELQAMLSQHARATEANQYGEAAYLLLKEILDILQPHIHLLPRDVVERILEAIKQTRTKYE
jgi:hypothetical protein